MTKVIFSSDGMNLRFPDDELYEGFRTAEERVHVLAYAKIRARYGVWATNQGKFVTSRTLLNDWDSKRMENLWEKYEAPVPEVFELKTSFNAAKEGSAKWDATRYRKE